jgi:hypothetical protein
MKRKNNQVICLQSFLVLVSIVIGRKGEGPYVGELQVFIEFFCSEE